MKWITKASILTACMCMFAAGLFIEATNYAHAAEVAPTTPIAAIESITVSGDGAATALIIKLSGVATFTSYKTTAPLRLVIDFSQASPGAINKPVVVNKGNFKAVTANRFDTDAGMLTRVEIELLNDVEAVLAASPSDTGEVRVSFPVPVDTAKSATEPETKTAQEPVAKPVVAEPAAAAPAPVALPPAKFLTGISAASSSVLLALDGAVSDIKTFRLNKPERFIIDLFDVKCAIPTRIVPLNTAGVASARIGIYPDKVRVVLDAVNGSFPEARAIRSNSGVVVYLGPVSAAEQMDAAPVVTSVPVAEKPAPVKQEPVAEKSAPVAAPTKKSAKYFGPTTVEMIDFQVIDNISRVSVKVRGEIESEAPVQSPGFVTLTIKNAALPKHLQRSLETRSFVSPVLRVTPVAVKNKKKGETRIRIAMRASAGFDYRQEGDMLYIDFKNPAGMTAETLAIETADAKPRIAILKPAAADSRGDEIAAELAPAAGAAAAAVKPGGKNYSGRRVTLEFADAEVRKIFQLLSEVSNKNFVLGDDVTGAISLKLVNVPWDQALDIILDTKGLDKREDGNIILIKGKGKFKSQAEEELEIKKTAAKSIELKTETFSVNYASIGDITGQFDKLKTPERGQISSDARTNKVIVKDTPQALEDMRKLLAQLDVPERQVMIEARIIEATSTFTRNLGVNWGIHFKDGTGSILGINALDTGFGGLTSAPPTTGTGQAPGGSMGISFGTLGSNVQLDMRLNAAASAGMIKIISSPKVATLNHKAAKISQGQKIPYQNTTSTSGATTQFIDAALSLDVTPHINANGTVVMQIKATNSSAGSGSPPPINTKEATTEMLLKDGETTVIGGIYVDSDTQGDEGVPFLMDIPFLGKLFKSNTATKVKTELLIFITPRILGAV
ncbi:MAG: type IV pilus secretin PilQ [Desulfuromonadales bacterium]